MRASFWTALVASTATLACTGGSASDLPRLSRDQGSSRLEIGESRPAIPETQASGVVTARITRQSARFSELVECSSTRIAFKNEEGTGADRLMTPRLRSRLYRLAERVTAEWPGIELRVTEAWDEDGEHGGRSLHYEGRAADLTTTDRDPGKLGRLAALAVDAGFDWVYHEPTHVHASVR